MKKIKAVLVLVFLCLVVAAQDIPKHANLISINTGLSNENAYSKLILILFTNGYGTEHADRQSGTITTSDKSTSFGSVKLIAIIADSIVILRGSFKGPVLLDGNTMLTDPSEIQFFGMGRSMMKKAWDEMFKIAQQLPGEKNYLVK
jgi:hypothetical protein